MIPSDEEIRKLIVDNPGQSSYEYALVLLEKWMRNAARLHADDMRLHQEYPDQIEKPSALPDDEIERAYDLMLLNVEAVRRKYGL